MEEPRRGERVGRWWLHPNRKDAFGCRPGLHGLERHRDSTGDRGQALRNTGMVADVRDEEPFV